MKYVKNFEAKKRKEKDTDKYLSYLYEMFKDAIIINIIENFKDFTIKLQYRGIDKNELKIIQEYFEKYYIYMKPTYGNYITVEIDNITSDFWEPFDMKINSKKYNL